MSEKLNATLKQLEQGVKDFFDSDNFKDYLSVMSRFHHYSLNNQVLIAMQNRNATLVAGYNSWIKNFNRYVKKDEKAITILAPMKYKVDVDTGKEDEYGNAIVEKQERISFRPVSVFDVSQTGGEPLPTLINELDGSVLDYDKLMDKIRNVSPYPIRFEEIEGSAKGYCNTADKFIAIKTGMSELHTIKTAIHELAHARLHENSDKYRWTKEVEAESVAYVVCQHLGLDTSDYSFGYVAVWAKDKDQETLKETLNTIREEASAIISELEQKEQNLEKMIPETDKVLKDACPEIAVNNLYITGTQTVDGETKVNAIADYRGTITEIEAWKKLHDKELYVDGKRVNITPIKPDNLDEVPKPEFGRGTDDSWPMVTVTYSSTPDIQVGSMNIFDAREKINACEQKLEGKKGDFLRINIAYTYMGKQVEKTDVVILGEGRRNFIDYLELPSPVISYLHRHTQLLDKLDRANGEEAIRPGSKMQEDYMDMMYEWAEKQRLELNYKENPNIENPPNFNPLVNQHRGWRVER